MMDIRLDVATHKSIYLTGVAAPVLCKTTSSDQPVAVFVGGQPGCGKSTVARTSRTWFANGNFVHVDVDRLRELHPQYLPLVTNPATERAAPSAVQKDCSAWADMLRDDAAAQHRNILLESSMRVPGQFRESVQALRQNGYSVEVRIIAVHEKASEVSLALRFEHEKRVLGYGREIPPAYHDLAAAGILDTVRMLESEQLADHLLISDRAGNTIFENLLRNGEWVEPATGASVMEAFRVESYSIAEKQKIAALWSEVVDMMELRGAPAAELAHVVAKAEQAHKISQKAVEALQTLTANEVNADLQGVCVGDFNGRILEHRLADKFVVQKIGRDPDRVALHSTGVLSRVPEVGEVVDIKYRAGVGQVSERPLEAQISR